MHGIDKYGTRCYAFPYSNAKKEKHSDKMNLKYLDGRNKSEVFN